MWLPSLSTIAILAASFQVALSTQIQQLHPRKDGKPTTKNPIIAPLGGTLDTTAPIDIKWKPDTKGTITLKLIKGKAPNGMTDHEIIALHIKNTGNHVWITDGPWLEDSSTMEKGHKYGIKIIDDETGDYNFSPAFDLSVPGSTFKEDETNIKPSVDDGDDDDYDDYDDETDGLDNLDDEDGEDIIGDEEDDEEDDTPPHTVVDDDGTTEGHDYDEDDEDDEGHDHKDDDVEGHDDDNDDEGHDDDEEDDNKPPTNLKHHQYGHPKATSELDDEPDFIEPEGSATGENHHHRKPKPKHGKSGTTTSSEDDFDLFNLHKPHPSGAQLKSDSPDNTSSNSSSSSNKGLSKTAKIGIAVGVVVFFVILALAIAAWRITKHKKSQKEKLRSRIGYEGVGGFIADGRKSQLYDAPPQMTQYNPTGRKSVETRYDPPTGQGLPVVGSTPRQSIETRYDPPSQAHYHGH